MRRTIAISFLLIAAALLLPLLFSSLNLRRWIPVPEEGMTAEPQVSNPVDEAMGLTALIDGTLVETTMADYLPGVLAGEMPASFEPEALKAQAIAARTYILYRMQHTSATHPDAQVCSDINCCAAYKSMETLQESWGADFAENQSKILRAVQETDGQYLVYAEAPIQAVFHSSSAGMTEDSGNIWGDLPYLVSVESPETEAEVPNFISSLTLSADEFRRVILMTDPRADLSGDVSGWVETVRAGETGRVESATIGGVTFSGTDLRAMFALRSTAFTLEYGGGQFVFTAKGYGHGVGMSQYGANVLAERGYGCSEILEHYYRGASIAVWSAGT